MPRRPRDTSDVIVVNKAWSSSGDGLKRLTKLPMDQLVADVAILWLWTAVEHVPSIFPILQQWRFQYRSILAWENTDREEDPLLDRMAEFFIVAAKGNPGIDPQYKAGNYLKTGTKTGTSEPLGVFKMIEHKCTGQARLEIFAESARDGWRAWPPVDDERTGEKPEGETVTEKTHTAETVSSENRRLLKAKKAEPQAPESIEPEGERS